MNRQHRRQIGRQGQESSGDGGDGATDATDTTDVAAVGSAAVDAAMEADTDGRTTTRARPRQGRAPSSAPTHHRVAPRQFLHEVNVELRKVAWPTRAETINYSTVVFVTLAILMAMIFGLDTVFTKLAGFLFNP